MLGSDPSICIIKKGRQFPMNEVRPLENQSNKLFGNFKETS